MLDWIKAIVGALVLLVVIVLMTTGIAAFVGELDGDEDVDERLRAIEIVARHHAQTDADWWQIVELAGGDS